MMMKVEVVIIKVIEIKGILTINVRQLLLLSNSIEISYKLPINYVSIFP